MFTFVTAFLLIGCRPLPADPPPMPVDVGAVTPPQAFLGEAESAALALIAAERAGSISGDLDALELIWAEDAQIIDGRTTATAEDDYVWSGREAILDRYVVAVFPVPPPPMVEPLQVEVIMDGDEASVVSGVDQWRFVREDGRWRIAELAYQRP